MKPKLTIHGQVDGDTTTAVLSTGSESETYEIKGNVGDVTHQIVVEILRRQQQKD